MSYTHRLLLCTALPGIEPVTLNEAKLFLRIDTTADDALITDLIATARAAAEKYTGRSFITQSWKIAFDDGLRDGVCLPYGPVQSVTSIIAYDVNGVAATISSAAYRLNAAKDSVQLDSAVYGHRVEVVYVAGYGTASDVPKPLKQGILTHCASMYEHRDAGVVLPLSAQGLYGAYRELRL